MEGPGPEDPTVLRYDLKDIPSKEDTLAWIEEKRQVPHSKDDFSRTPFAVAACHHGLFNSHIFDSKRLNQRAFYPLERLEDGGQLPSTL